MPRAKSLNGIIIREAHLQIDLRKHGYGRERLELLPTPANIRYAEKLRNEIMGKIERGTFALSEYFPDSPRATADVASLTFGQTAEEWLKIKAAAVQHSTVHHYAQTIHSAYFDTVRETLIKELDYRKLMRLTAALPTNPKTFNNFATVLRQILAYAFKAKMIPESLHEHVVMRRRQKPQPDPFELPEVLELLRLFDNPRARNYYEVAFFTGLRPSEQIALRWRNVDLAAGQLTVSTARTRGKEKSTKTNVVRTLELTRPALETLKRQQAITGGALYVFLDDENNPFTTTDEPLRSWWKPLFNLTSIRARDARQTRHTFATTGLMGGIAPGWLASQLGHSPEMFFRVYSRWIEGADKGAERRKMDAHLSGFTVSTSESPAAAPTGTKTGTKAPKTT